MRVHSFNYTNNSQLAQWNNEGREFNQAYKDNFVKVLRFAMIKAEGDTMVFPNEGEWWGHFADGSLQKVLKMMDTVWYKNDTFGLQTVDKAGKIFFNSTPGNHLQFSEYDLAWWVHNYFVDQ